MTGTHENLNQEVAGRHSDADSSHDRIRQGTAFGDARPSSASTNRQARTTDLQMQQAGGALRAQMVSFKVGENTLTGAVAGNKMVTNTGDTYLVRTEPNGQYVLEQANQSGHKKGPVLEATLTVMANAFSFDSRTPKNGVTDESTATSNRQLENPDRRSLDVTQSVSRIDPTILSHGLTGLAIAVDTSSNTNAPRAVLSDTLKTGFDRLCGSDKRGADMSGPSKAGPDMAANGPLRPGPDMAANGPLRPFAASGQTGNIFNPGDRALDEAARIPCHPAMAADGHSASIVDKHNVVASDRLSWTSTSNPGSNPGIFSDTAISQSVQTHMPPSNTLSADGRLASMTDSRESVSRKDFFIPTSVTPNISSVARAAEANVPTSKIETKVNDRSDAIIAIAASHSNIASLVSEKPKLDAVRETKTEHGGESPITPANKPENVKFDPQAVPAARVESLKVDSPTIPATRPETVKVDLQAIPATRPETVKVDLQAIPATRPETVKVDLQAMPAIRPETVKVDLQVIPATRPENVKVDLDVNTATRAENIHTLVTQVATTRIESAIVDLPPLLTERTEFGQNPLSTYEITNRRFSEEEEARKEREEQRMLAQGAKERQDIAFLAAIEQRRLLEQKERALKEQLQLAEKEKKNHDNNRRRRYVVRHHDTLQSIAANQLRNVKLTSLIHSINRLAIPFEVQDGEAVYSIRVGQVIWLPSNNETTQALAAITRDQARGTSQSATEELETRFGANWGGADMVHANGGTRRHGDEDPDAIARKRHNIESFLGKLSQKKEQCDRIQYRIRLGDTLKSIALNHPAMSDVSLWKLLAQVNNLSTEIDDKGSASWKLQRGDILVLPKQSEIQDYRTSIGVADFNSLPLPRFSPIT